MWLFFKNILVGFIRVVQPSPELSVEDSNNTGALQAVVGGGALSRLKSVRQPLDFIPRAQILWRTPRLQIQDLQVCSVWKVDIHPGGIEILLNGGPRASARLDDLSLSCQDRQQSERNHLIDIHVSLHSLQAPTKKRDYRSVRKKETATWSSGGLLLASCMAGIQEVLMGFICIGYMPFSTSPFCLLAIF